jgi:hypothetical protein
VTEGILLRMSGSNRDGSLAKIGVRARVCVLCQCADCGDIHEVGTWKEWTLTIDN